MRIWKRSIALKILCLGLLAESQVCGFESYNPCCDPCPSGLPEIYLGAELLYWKPCVGGLDWGLFSKDDLVAPEDPVGVGKFLHIDPEWEGGLRFRIGKDMIYQGIGLSGSYTYLKASQSDSKKASQGQTLIPTLVHGGTIGVDNFPAEYANADWALRYQTFDVLLSYPMECYECHFFTPYFGAEGMILHQSFSSHFFADPQDEIQTHWESDYFGVGMKLGGFYAFRLNRCLSAFGDVSASILNGDAEMKDRSIVNVDLSDNRDLPLHNEDCLFLPGYRISFGISWQFEICHFAMDIHGGYEFLRWHNIPNPRKYVRDAGAVAISTSPITSTLGFHGIFLGSDVHF